jgi:hypothetical protein
MAARALALIALWFGVAHAQAGRSTSEILRDGNAAALAGQWLRVTELVEPLLQRELADAELGEAHRLAGIAAFFEQRSAAAEGHFVAFLRIELAGRLDPALYPPEVVAFFNEVAARHDAEFRAVQSPPRRTWVLTLLPPVAQFQNGDRIKAYALGGALGGLLIANLTTYYYLRAWCEHTDGTSGGGLSCYDGGDHNHDAARLRPYNIATGIGFLALYAYGVFDGIWGYHQRSREPLVQPFAAVSAERRVVGIGVRF